MKNSKCQIPNSKKQNWPLEFGIWNFVITSTLMMGFAIMNTANAQSSTPPSDLKFICGAASSTTKVAHCVLQVPSDLIGASFDIQVPKQKFTQIQNAKKGDAVPNSGLFFQLEATDQGSNYLFQVDYADMKAASFGSSAYALFQFDITLVFSGQNDFPITIPAPMRVGGQLYTPVSLAQNQASFRAGTEVPLEIRIDSMTESSVAPATIDSSFKFSASAPADDGYCFDDPVDSMTTAEWTIVCDAKSRGIVSGNPRDNGIYFFPNQQINRAEAVKIVTLGILRSLGYLSDSDFSSEEARIRSSEQNFITYPDIKYEADGAPPWFAVYVNIAGQKKIAEGYPHDGTFKPNRNITNAESYRVIVETGRVASTLIAKALEKATRSTSLKTEDWFLKYASTLAQYNIKYSKEYGVFTTRKEFLIIVMNLLAAVGL